MGASEQQIPLLPSKKYLDGRHLDRVVEMMNQSALDAYAREPMDSQQCAATTTPIKAIESFDPKTGKITFKEDAYLRHRLPQHHSVEEGGENFLDVFVKNGLSKDSHVVWHTTAGDVRQLQEWGGIEGDTLTSKVICKVGEFRSLVAKRAIESSVLDQHAEQEENIAMAVIQRARILEPIELLVNRTNELAKLEEAQNDKEGVKPQLEAAIEELRQALTNYLSKIDAADQAVVAKLDKSYQKDIAVVKVLQRKLSIVELGLKFHGNTKAVYEIFNTKIDAFVKARLENAIGFATGATERIGYQSYQKTFSKKPQHLLRGNGRLHDFLAEAFLTTNKHICDSNRQPKPSNQLNFGDPATAVLIDTRKFEIKSRVQFEHFLRGVSVIDQGLNVSDFASKCNRAVLASWNSRWFDPYGKSKPLGYAMSTVLAVPNYLATTFGGSSAIEDWLASKNAINLNGVTGVDYVRIMDLLGCCQETAAHDLGMQSRKVVRVVRHAVVDSAIALAERGAAQARELKKDFTEHGYYGRWKRHHETPSVVSRKRDSSAISEGEQDSSSKISKTAADQEPVIAAGSEAKDSAADKQEKLEKFFNTLQELDAKLPEQWPELRALMEQITQQQQTQRTAGVAQEKFVHIDEHLGAYRPYDVFSGLINGIRLIFDYFKDEVHTKNPLIGGVAISIYYYAFMASFNPDLIPEFLRNQKVMDASNLVGNAMASGPASAGIGSGFLFYKAFYAAMNGMQQGSESWIWDLASAFGRNPGMATIAIAASWFTGYAVTELVDIPFLTEHLREDLGTIPFFAQFFAGLKILALTFEFFAEDEKQEKSYFGQSVGDITQVILTSIRALLSPFSGSLEAVKDFGRIFVNAPKIAAYNTLGLIKTVTDYTNLIFKDLMVELPGMFAGLIVPETGVLKQEISQFVYENTTGILLEFIQSKIQDMGREHVRLQDLAPFEKVKERVLKGLQEYVENQAKEATVAPNAASPQPAASMSVTLLQNSGLLQPPHISVSAAATMH